MNGLIIKFAPDTRQYTDESGSAVELHVKLIQEPNWNAKTVEFDVYTSDSTEGVVRYPTKVIFTKQNWNITQPVYIEGQYDAIVDGDVLYNISFIYANEYTQSGVVANDPSFARYHYQYPVQHIEILNLDSGQTPENRVNGLIIDLAPDSGSLYYSDGRPCYGCTDESGTRLELHVKLIQEPNWNAKTVEFDVYTSDSTEGIVNYPSTVIFTKQNWNIPQSVYVEGQYDMKVDGDVHYNISFIYSSEYTQSGVVANDPSFARYHYQHPAQHIELINLDSKQDSNTTNGLRIKWGKGTRKYTSEVGSFCEIQAKLEYEPNWQTETVVFDVFSSDTTEGAINFPSSLTFTHQNWDIWQPIYVQGIPDGKKDGDVYYNVSFSYVSEFTPGAQFKSNDPSFSRDHFKYPIQHFLILNYDSDSGLNGTNATINNRLYIDLATDSPKRYREGQTPIGFTTEAGGVVELLVSLVEEPNWETEKITFFIFTSDATEGVVKYPTLVAFTHQNWDIKT